MDKEIFELLNRANGTVAVREGMITLLVVALVEVDGNESTNAIAEAEAKLRGRSKFKRKL